MNDWWSAVALFWALYLADGVNGGRRERLFLAAWRGGWRWRFWRRRKLHVPRTATLCQAGWHFAPPLPWAYSLPLEDLPAALSPEGLVNWSCAATARPPWRPDRPAAARWEAAGKVGLASGWITLDGRRFVPATNALDARELRTLTERLGPLPPERRGAEIAAWLSRHFSVTRARRRLAAGLARTRALAWMNTLQCAGWIALSAALVSGAFDPSLPFGTAGSWRWLDPAQIRWWSLCGWLAAMHLLTLGTAWRLHRKLHPHLKEERSNLIFGALLLPAQALRLRAALLRPLARGLAPLAFTLAAGTPATARAAAAATLRDVAFPARPAGLPPDFTALNDAAGALARPVLERTLTGAANAAGGEGLGVEELLAQPADLEAGVCAYCPRCGDGFLRPDGVCPQGVRLKPVSMPTRE